jgi:hypothetical protein
MWRRLTGRVTREGDPHGTRQGRRVWSWGLPTQRGHARWLRETKNAHFVFPVLDNQPTLFDQLDALTWTDVPITAFSVDEDRAGTSYAPSRSYPPHPA